MDIMKGILILLVVYGHMAWQAHEVGIHNQTIEILGQTGFLYDPFYMTAFGLPLLGKKAMVRCTKVDTLYFSRIS